MIPKQRTNKGRDFLHVAFKNAEHSRQSLLIPVGHPCPKDIEYSIILNKLFLQRFVFVRAMFTPSIQDLTNALLGRMAFDKFQLDETDDTCKQKRARLYNKHITSKMRGNAPTSLHITRLLVSYVCSSVRSSPILLHCEYRVFFALLSEF